MRKNIFTAIKDGRKLIQANPLYDLNNYQFSEMIERGKEESDPTWVIYEAFLAGVDTGNRIANKQIKRND